MHIALITYFILLANCSRSHCNFSSAFVPIAGRVTPRRNFSSESNLSLLRGTTLISKKFSPTNLSTTFLKSGVIIDVDDNFFTVAFFSIGLFYSLGKAYNRFLLEEVAFEQRKLEARERRLEQDPTVSELDLRREESESWASVYGNKRKREKVRGSEQEELGQDSWRKSRVAVLDRPDEEDYGMSDEERSIFESKYGVEYDPYYDEPYEESELPVGKYKEDKSYGDRRYENGEVFYKDEQSGMFYRQGARPRQKKFWDLNSN